MCQSSQHTAVGAYSAHDIVSKQAEAKDGGAIGEALHGESVQVYKISPRIVTCIVTDRQAYNKLGLHSC